ncbi:voltage-dependent anion-selective channel-like [Drosophila novamexicana]|uniref:voltage-dependent anion-selective channel-like n=1 Tax=Drosophila novamexicana TaxID=47314 RepID=UPI0011E5FC36|nr:voltage-dependent anion-selective channel-like [Drosophila novamexicana]
MSVYKRFTLKKKKREGSNAEDDEPRSSSDGEVIPKQPLEGEMPTFFHVGKWAKQCLTTGYDFGAWHIDCTTNVSEKLGLYSFGSARPDVRNVAGGVGIREKLGIFNLYQTWQTNGLLSTLGVRTEAAGGLANAMLRATYIPQNNDGVNVELYTGYERPPVKLDVIIPVLNVPKFMGYVLLHLADNYMFAYRSVYNINDMEFEKHVLCVGYQNENTEYGLKLENFKELRGSLFQRVGERWAFALKAHLYREQGRHFSVGGQYKIHEDGLLKMRVRENGFMGLVYQAILSENIDVMYHVGINAKSPLDGNHKFGVAWSLKC